jgi:uncharacterized protein YecT (DUF1311 family)
LNLAIITAAALVTAAGVAQAAPASNAFKDLDCRKAAVQTELNVCADREFESWDAKLNALYRALLKNSDPKEQPLLKSAERSWITYRDNECAFETSGSEGGSIHPMEYSNCLTDKTRARIAELKKQGD